MDKELEQIAASVAKAMKLIAFGEPTSYWREEWNKNDIDHRKILESDGSNLFDPYWQVRCRDWLLTKEYSSIHFQSSNANTFVTPDDAITVVCPASEFCARAIHELLSS